MKSTENGECKVEIQKDLETGTIDRKMQLMDYVPTYIPSTVDKELSNQSIHDEKRILDFLRAHPTRDWFLRFGFFGRASPFSSLGRNESPTKEHLSSSSHASRWQRFHVIFVRKINWEAIAHSCKNWIKNPANIALFIWLIFVAAGLLLLFLLMTGMLNRAVPSSSRRKDWNEITNQILNALFTIMCLYQHPRLFHHLILLFRWKLFDQIGLRKVYCKDGVIQPHERAHMMLVVLLLHITCFTQYTLIGLYWGYNMDTRPDWAVTMCITIGIVAPVIAGVYTMYGPLGRKNSVPETDKGPQQCQAHTVKSTHQGQIELKVYNSRVMVTNPEWIGGLFNCWDDLRVFYLSFFCTFCVFGWNMERLGFGNMYVHIATFLLLCAAPFLVFNISALNIEDSSIRYIVGITGTVAAIFGLLYGGFWRMQMRKRFKIPPNPSCYNYPVVTDCMQWLFCWSCSLAQEVRTGNFYDIENDGLYRKVSDEDGHPVLLPLLREGGSGFAVAPSIGNPIWSYSCPPKFQPANLQTSADNLKDDGSQTELSFLFERSSTYSNVHTMRAPLQPVFQIEAN